MTCAVMLSSQLTCASPVPSTFTAQHLSPLLTSLGTAYQGLRCKSILEDASAFFPTSRSRRRSLDLDAGDREYELDGGVHFVRAELYKALLAEAVSQDAGVSLVEAASRSEEVEPEAASAISAEPLAPESELEMDEDSAASPPSTRPSATTDDEAILERDLASEMMASLSLSCGPSSASRESFVRRSSHRLARLLELEESRGILGGAAPRPVSEAAAAKAAHEASAATPSATIPLPGEVSSNELPSSPWWSSCKWFMGSRNTGAAHAAPHAATEHAAANAESDFPAWQTSPAASTSAVTVRAPPTPLPSRPCPPPSSSPVWPSLASVSACRQVTVQELCAPVLALVELRTADALLRLLREKLLLSAKILEQVQADARGASARELAPAPFAEHTTASRPAPLPSPVPAPAPVPAWEGSLWHCTEAARTFQTAPSFALSVYAPARAVKASEVFFGVVTA